MEINKALEAIPQKNNSGLILTTLSRPSLAVLSEDHKKLRNINDKSESDGLINYLLTILNIKVSTQEEADDLKVQMLVVDDFLKTKFGHLTIPEIREAFKMYVSKEFPGIKVFRLLDCVSTGEILNAYTEFRADSLRTYSQKKMNMQNQLPEISKSEKENIIKNGVNRVFQEYVDSKIVQDNTEYIFDFLIEKGIIKNGTNQKLVEYYQSKLNQATEMVKNELKQLIFSENDLIRKQAKEDLEVFNLGNNHKAIIKAKRLVLIEFFDKKIIDKTELIFKT